MPFLPPNQQRQSTEGNYSLTAYHVNTDAGQPRTHKSSVMSSSDSRNASFTQVSLLLTACPLPDLDLDLSLITRT